MNQLVALAMLRALGPDCEIASDGVAALEAWRRGDFDLVLMDCQMPNMDGYTATRCIREEAACLRLPRVPIVALTANVVAGVRAQCDAAGMDNYLSKPYSEGALAQVLARWLPRGGLPISEAAPSTPAG